MDVVNQLSFPGLGLAFTLNKVAVTLFGKPIYWYAIIIVSGFLLAWFYCSKKGPKLGISSDDLVDLLIFAVPSALVGARIYYVVFYLDLYKRPDGTLDFPAMLRIWDGGIAIYGAVIAAAVVLYFVCRVKKIPFLAFADLGVLGLLIGQSIGRWGNFVNVEAYGGVTTVPWRMCSPQIASELFGQGLVDAAGYQQIMEGALGVHPTFFYESLWNAVGFLLLVLISRRLRKFDGQIFFGYLVWYGVGRGIIEGMRTDSLYVFNTGIRASQLLGYLSAAVGITLLIIWYRRKLGPEHLWVNRCTAVERASPESAQQENLDEEENDYGSDSH